MTFLPLHSPSVCFDYHNISDLALCKRLSRSSSSLFSYYHLALVLFFRIHIHFDVHWFACEVTENKFFISPLSIYTKILHLHLPKKFKTENKAIKNAFLQFVQTRKAILQYLSIHPLPKKLQTDIDGELFRDLSPLQVCICFC